MADIQTVRTWRGHTLIDRDGGYIGRIDAIYVDDRSGQPEWALVSIGLGGTRSTFVPIAQATSAGGDVQVPYHRQQVQDAPGIAPDRHLSVAEEQQLFRHYGLDYGAGHTATPPQGPRGTREAGVPAAAGETGADLTEAAADADRGTAREASGQTGDDAMTRSEEELRVGTQARERGRVRLRKYVTTEEVTQTVPVRREQVRLEPAPAADADDDAAPGGPADPDAGQAMVLHEEVPVVEKRVVPRERVRLGKQTVTGEEQVTEEVRKERIDVEDDSGRDQPPAGG
jgi:uncharacterized protein (TIGR02271 family)